MYSSTVSFDAERSSRHAGGRVAIGARAHHRSGDGRGAPRGRGVSRGHRGGEAARDQDADAEGLGNQGVITMKPTVRILSKELAYDIMPDVSMANDLLCRYEEQASLWIWAYPELLGWRREIRWLFSPVVGKQRFPGDLWGIDSNSNLIIVETKLAKTDKGQDPFVDFIAFEEDRAKGLRIDIIQMRWESLFKDQYLRQNYVKEKGFWGKVVVFQDSHLPSKSPCQRL